MRTLSGLFRREDSMLDSPVLCECLAMVLLVLHSVNLFKVS